MLLERFRTAKREELEALRSLAARHALPAPREGVRPDFRAALRRDASGLPAVIAEYKRASPSRGVIREDMDAAEAARRYADGGAAALSILTEERYFKGSLTYLDEAAAALGEHRPPLLRKDFIFDPLQVTATAATAASALLLIVRLTPEAGLLRDLREQAESFGMQAVVEVFDAEDLELARRSGARVIQVNARDLETFAVDVNAGLELIRRYPPLGEERWIAASGLSRTKHLRAAAEVGYDAVLIGTALMEQGDPGAALRALLRA
ncbi:MAG: indole-3-glycerol phosphate synthase TrpC [Desulfovibrio sp.]|uniref:indole-3-glycerol phosphate synthase TrpC n=1 Tax=Desulfovibrio sp. TaxID=885 RepID=UPI0025BD68EB|nr:indole-3-glycerol phosphate synthase TrpC [Desulfovibrio sp.]MCI7568268.1 indole-3-glycerol phosphate synthase TrpC [Desulfovibrio sp.]